MPAHFFSNYVSFRYHLTDAGHEMAVKLLKASAVTDKTPAISPSSTSSSAHNSLSSLTKGLKKKYPPQNFGAHHVSIALILLCSTLGDSSDEAMDASPTVRSGVSEPSHWNIRRNGDHNSPHWRFQYADSCVHDKSKNKKGAPVFLNGNLPVDIREIHYILFVVSSLRRFFQCCC